MKRYLYVGLYLELGVAVGGCDEADHYDASVCQESRFPLFNLDSKYTVIYHESEEEKIEMPITIEEIKPFIYRVSTQNPDPGDSEKTFSFVFSSSKIGHFYFSERTESGKSFGAKPICYHLASVQFGKWKEFKDKDGTIMRRRRISQRPHNAFSQRVLNELEIPYTISKCKKNGDLSGPGEKTRLQIENSKARDRHALLSALQTPAIEPFGEGDIKKPLAEIFEIQSLE